MKKCQEEIEQDRKGKVPEPEGDSARKPGTRWVAGQEPPGAAARPASVGVAAVAVVVAASVGETNNNETIV